MLIAHVPINDFVNDAVDLDREDLGVSFCGNWCLCFGTNY